MGSSSQHQKRQVEWRARQIELLGLKEVLRLEKIQIRSKQREERIAQWRAEQLELRETRRLEARTRREQRREQYQMGHH